MNQEPEKTFDEIKIGETYCSEGRTITESDIVSFADLSGDYNRLHMDEEYMKKSIFKRRIAHGLLILSIQSGLGAQVVKPSHDMIAFLGILQWKFKKPVFIGDTIYVKMMVSKKTETSKLDRGIVEWKREVYNQNQEVVQEGYTLVMIRR